MDGDLEKLDRDLERGFWSVLSDDHFDDFPEYLETVREQMSPAEVIGTKSLFERTFERIEGFQTTDEPFDIDVGARPVLIDFTSGVKNTPNDFSLDGTDTEGIRPGIELSVPDSEAGKMIKNSIADLDANVVESSDETGVFLLIPADQ